MNFCDDTIQVLKNFALINPSIEFVPGSKLKTVSPQKSILAEASIQETIPRGGAVYELNRFLGTLSLFEKSADIKFSDKYMTIADGKKSVNYTFADASMIISAPDKEISMPDHDVAVNLMWNDLNSVLKASADLNLPEVAVTGYNGNIKLQAIDSKNPTADKFEVELGRTDKEFRFIFKTENLKLLSLNYEVVITSKGIGKFSSLNTQGPRLIYYIALESNSTVE